MFIEPSSAISVGLAVLENRKKLWPLIKKLRLWLRRGRLQIAIFGPGGTGKTTLGQILSGNLGPGAGPTAYKESLDIETYSLTGDMVCSLLVAPGQRRRAEYTWPTLFKSLAQGESGGVINVVSWGYHSFQDLSYKDTKYFEKKMSQKQFVSHYLEESRKREIQVLEELSPRLMDAKKKIWMITLVTKQDLWWKDRIKVRAHYMEGSYNDHIKEIANKRGQQNFAHEYLSASLVISNLGTTAGELLAPTTGGYDQNIQYANLRQLFDAVVNFAQK